MADAFGSTSFGGFTTPSFRKSMLGATKPKKDEDIFNFDVKKSQLYQNSSNTANNFMSGATPEFDAQANIARDAQKVSQANAAKSAREQLMGFGMRDSGQYITEGILGPADTASREKATLERSLAVDRQAQATSRQQTGMAAASALIGQDQQQQQYNSGLKVNQGQFASSQAQQQKQYESDLDYKNRMAVQQQGQFESDLEYKNRLATQEQNRFESSQAQQQGQFTASQAQQQGQFESDLDYKNRMAAIQQQQFTSSQSQQQGQFESDLDYKNRMAVQQQGQFTASQSQQQGQFESDLDYKNRMATQQQGQFESDLAYKNRMADQEQNQFSASQQQQQQQFTSSQNQQQGQFESDLAYKNRMADQSQQQFDATMTQQQGQFESDLDYKNRMAAQDQSQFDASQSQQQGQFESDLDYKNRLAQQDQNQFTASQEQQNKQFESAQKQEQGQFESDLDYKNRMAQQNQGQFDSSQDQDQKQFDANIKFQTSMAELDKAFQEKNINFSALMEQLYSGNLPPEQAAAILKQTAAGAGITMPEFTQDAAVASTNKTLGKEVMSGAYTKAQIQSDPEIKAAAVANAIEWGGDDFADKSGKNTFRFQNTPEKNIPFKYNGQTYIRTGDVKTNKEFGFNKESIEVLNLTTNKTETITADKDR